MNDGIYRDLLTNKLVMVARVNVRSVVPIDIDTGMIRPNEDNLVYIHNFILETYLEDQIRQGGLIEIKDIEVTRPSDILRSICNSEYYLCVKTSPTRDKLIGFRTHNRYSDNLPIKDIRTGFNHKIYRRIDCCKLPPILFEV